VSPGRPLHTSLALLIGGLAIAHATSRNPGGRQPRGPAPWDVTFTDIAERSGLRAETVYGGIYRKRLII
jgi:hypothetical protein